MPDQRLAFESRVEQKTPGSDKEIASVGYREDRIVTIFPTAEKALHSEPHEQEVGHGVDDLGRVDGGIVVLLRFRMSMRLSTGIGT